MSLSRPPSTTAPALFLAGALLLLSPRSAQAESKISYKYSDYQESAGRIGVQAHSALIEQSLGPDATLSFTGVIDVIAGATPTGEAPAARGGPVPLAELRDRRNAWTVDYARQFTRTNLSVGVAQSREHDYISHGASLNTRTDFNDKNTALTLGVSATDDTILVFYQTDRVKKRGFDAFVGVNQIVDPQTTLAFNLSFGRTTGYLSDPYKTITQVTQLLPGVFLPLTFPENRPGERNKWLALVGYNHAVHSLNGALDASYRLYHDSFGTTSHTFAGAWLQRLGPKVILTPSFRYYRQDAAAFYRVSLNGAGFVPALRPNTAGPFYSADYRLSSLRSLTYGLKVVWNPTEKLHFDLAWDRYEMTGLDRITSASAYAKARIVTVGAGLTW